jgi:predicted nucleic acid-binding protein
MNVNADIFFDTNILLYAYAGHDPQKQAVAKEYIADAFRYGIGVVSVQVLSEFTVNACKKLIPSMTLRQARTEMELFASDMRVVSLETAHVWEAVHLAEEYEINYWDALILAAAERAKCRTLLTEDLTHNHKYGTVKAINPFK